MDVAFCYESVLPARGGCETYIADLARQMTAEGHAVHLYACRWDSAALPATIHYHPLPSPRGPRFIRPWRFSAVCTSALERAGHDLSVGFNKTWGQDVLYPLAGLHVASAEHNIRKHRRPLVRGLARAVKALDVAHWSFSRLERQQYFGARRPLVVVNSNLVREHFQSYYGIPPTELRVVHNAIDPKRFAEGDRLRRRLEWRQRWGIRPEETVGLFVAMNYQLKGLEPLLCAVARLPAGQRFRLLVAGNPKFRVYERQARRLRIADRVCFAGYMADARNCYFASDFLVHPTFYDPCSLVVLEALACGLPVITSRYNGASELLSDEKDGYIIDDPHDDRRLAWCLTQLLDTPRRRAFSDAARHKATAWTFDHHFRQLLEVFAEAAARRQAA
jgi:UDP-glucose:(heptosyl)LPS alpha-1,3-glucosyltransferase